MTLTVTILGREVLRISTDPADDDKRGDVTTSPVGFAPRVDLPIREPGRTLT
jgi:hypothetical protein